MFQSDRDLFQTVHVCMKRFHWKYGGSIVNIYQFLPRYCPCISTTNQTINLLHVYYKNSIIWILYDLFSRLWLHCYDTVFNNCYSSYFFISTKSFIILLYTILDSISKFVKMNYLKSIYSKQTNLNTSTRYCLLVENRKQTKNIFLKKKTLTIVYFTNVHNKNIARALFTYKTAL